MISSGANCAGASALAGVARATAPVAANVRSSRRDIVLIVTILRGGRGMGAPPRVRSQPLSPRRRSGALTDGQSSPSRVDRKLTDGFARPGLAESGARGMDAGAV